MASLFDEPILRAPLRGERNGTTHPHVAVNAGLGYTGGVHGFWSDFHELPDKFYSLKERNMARSNDWLVSTRFFVKNLLPPDRSQPCYALTINWTIASTSSLHA